jgi:hypothetical protein
VVPYDVSATVFQPDCPEIEEGKAATLGLSVQPGTAAAKFEWPWPPLILRGLRIGQVELIKIKDAISRANGHGRTKISRDLCETLEFRQENGWPKERAMRDILRRLDERGLIKLPLSKKPDPLNRRTKKHREIARPLDDTITSIAWDTLRIERVSKGEQSQFWNQMISDHHYLGRRPIVGRNLRQIVLAGQRPIACLAWGDPCLKLAPRDRYLAAKLAAADCDVKSGVNNCRFLILPWVAVPNLASKILSLATRHMRNFWLEYYHTQIQWAETFVDPTRFAGTCYTAANWMLVGRTEGTARSGCAQRRVMHGVRKNILVYVFRDALK